MSVNKKMLIGLVIMSIHLGQHPIEADTLHFMAPSKTSITTYHYEPVSTVDVCLDVGYFIKVNDTNDVKVSQSDMHGGDPFTTYYGCGEMHIFTTFPILLQTAVKATSPAGGNWSATLNSQSQLSLTPGRNSVAICVLGTHVQTHQLITDQAQENVSVAEITIQVIPR